MLENQFAEVLSLNGEWQAEVAGKRGPITVPGVWERAGFAADEERATYQREFTVPEAWRGRQVYLRFGAVSYDVEVVVNGLNVGRHEGMWTAFEFDVTDALQYGATNSVELRIVKSLNDGGTYPYREVLVGFIPYIAITFGGPWQSIELVAHQQPALAVSQLSADWQTGSVSISGTLEMFGASTSGAALTVDVLDGGKAVVASASLPAESRFETTLDVPNHALWSPASPSLYTLRLRLTNGDSVSAETSRRFGFRSLHADGERLLLNGKPISVRGVLSWGWKPSTLAPMPTDDEIRDEFHRVRELGFNLVKLCLFVPPQRVYEIADEEGMLLWLELPMWWQRVTPHLRQQAAIEYADIMRAVHHHPSIVIYSLGCELGSDMADAEMLSGLNTLVRGAAGGTLVCDNSGSGEAYAGLNFDYADFLDYHFYSDLHYFVPLLDHFRRDWRNPRPWIFGEYCDSDSYRDVAEISQGEGRPWWLDVYGVEGNPTRWAYAEQQERMAAHDLPFDDQHIKHASERQSFAVRKTILERSRARAAVGGYVLTGLRDSPISTSGVFDDLGRSKFKPASFRHFNADNVLLLETGRTRDWVNGGDRPAPRDSFNYVGGTTASLRILLSQTTLPETPQTLEFTLDYYVGLTPHPWSQTVEVTIPPAGIPQQIASFEVPLPVVEQAVACKLIAKMGETENTWEIWLYPPVDVTAFNVTAYDPLGAFGGLWPATDFSNPASVVITSFYDDRLRQYVEQGGRVILLQPGAGPVPTVAVPFWREAIKLLYDHPSLHLFPHTGYTDLQFYHLATDRAFTPDAFGDATLRPAIQRLDARLFSLSHYLVEVRSGQGRMLASTLRFFGGAGDQVQGLQSNIAAQYLLQQMIDTLLEKPSLF